MPETVTVEAAAPVIKLEGAKLEMAGAGLSISRSTAAPEPVVLVPLTTNTGSKAPLVSWDAGTDAVIRVASKKVVVSATPPTCTELELVKPVPVTIKVTVVVPAVMLAGETDVTVSAVAVVPPPLEPEEDDEGSLEQPPNKA